MKVDPKIDPTNLSKSQRFLKLQPTVSQTRFSFHLFRLATFVQPQYTITQIYHDKIFFHEEVKFKISDDKL